MENRNLLAIFCYNERKKIINVVKKFNNYSLYDVLIMDDGSTDSFEDDLKDTSLKFTILRNEINKGIGYSIRKVLKYAKDKNYEVAILVAGNDKDSPEDVDTLLGAIREGYDFVQGSRYVEGGRFGNMPLHRVFGTRYMHPLLFSLISGRKIADSANGFRAIRLSLLDDKRINLDQEWLDKYELEVYLFYKVIKLGYRVKEVPVKKIYPPKELGYSKIKPIVGWWSILRPIFFLGLGLKK